MPKGIPRRKVPYYECTCPICGDKYKSEHPSNSPCSDTCKMIQDKRARNKDNEYHRQRRVQKGGGVYDKVCVVCGIAFRTNIHNAVACSDVCREKHRANEQIRKNESRKLARKAHVRDSKSCVICGETFTPQYSNQITCSKACSQENQRVKTRDYNKVHPKSTVDRSENYIPKVEKRPPDVVCSYRVLHPGDPDFDRIAAQVTPINKITNVAQFQDAMPPRDVITDQWINGRKHL